eukprot:scaffold15294_cov101-Skeletonema_marinoi.AAC.1
MRGIIIWTGNFADETWLSMLSNQVKFKIHMSSISSHDIDTKYSEPLEELFYFIHAISYDTVLECCRRHSDSGDRLRCLIRSPTTLKRRRYEHSMLEPWKRCFYTIMANYNGSLEAVERHIHS